MKHTKIVSKRKHKIQYWQNMAEKNTWKHHLYSYYWHKLKTMLNILEEEMSLKYVLNY